MKAVMVLGFLLAMLSVFAVVWLLILPFVAHIVKRTRQTFRDEEGGYRFSVVVLTSLVLVALAIFALAANQ